MHSLAHDADVWETQASGPSAPCGEEGSAVAQRGDACRSLWLRLLRRMVPWVLGFAPHRPPAMPPDLREQFVVVSARRCC